MHEEKGLKRIAFVALLAVAGLFGISVNTISNNFNQSSLIKEAKAETRYVFFANVAGWAGGESRMANAPSTQQQAEADQSSCFWYTYFNSQSEGEANITPVLSSDIISGSFRIPYSDGSGYYEASHLIKLSVDTSYTKVRFMNYKGVDWGGWLSHGDNRQTKIITLSDVGDKTIICNTYYNGGAVEQYYDQDIYYNFPVQSSDNRNSLWFVPCYRWNDTNYSIDGYKTAYPYIYYQWTSGDGLVLQNWNWPGVKYAYCSDETNHKGVYRFDDVQNSSLKQLTIIYNNNLTGSNNPRLDFSPTSITSWQTGGKNLFAMPTDDNYKGETAVDMAGYTYNCATNAIVVGDFLLDGLSTAAEKTAFSTAHKLEGLSSSFACTIDVVKGDKFRYVLNALRNDNTAAYQSLDFSLSGNDNEADYHGYSTTYVHVYDGSESNEITGASYTNYLTNPSSSIIQFEKSGRIMFKRVTTDPTDLNIRVVFLPDDYDPSGYYVIGAGSFVNGKETWTTSSGLQMNDIGDYQIITEQYLETGDCFQISNGSSSYGFDNIVMQDSLTTSDYFFEAKYNFVTIKPLSEGGTDSYEGWKRELSNYPGVNGGSGETNPVDESLSVYWKTPTGWVDERQGVRCYYGDPSYTEYNTGGESGGGYEVVDSANNIYRNTRKIDDRSYLSGFSVYKNYKAQTTEWITRDSLFNNNIVVKKSGHYTLYLDSDNNINVRVHDNKTGFTIGQPLYLNTNGISWDADAQKVGAYFWNGDNHHSVEMTRVENHRIVNSGATGNSVFECMIPNLGTDVSPIVPINVIFYRAPTINPDNMNNQINQTGTLFFSGTSNTCTLGDWNSGAWSYNTNSYQRAEYLARRFNKDVTCDGGANAPSVTKWNNIGTEYANMCDSSKNILRRTYFKWSPNEDDNEIIKAVSKYDYIIWKYNKSSTIYTDFMTRSSNDSGSTILHNLSNNEIFKPFGVKENNTSIIIVVVASSLSVLSITALSILLVRRKKKEHTN